MKLAYVTCSGANEFTDHEMLFRLFQEFSVVEFGIQVSGKKCGFDSERFDWLLSLHKETLKRKITLPLALHLNQDWVENFCNGIVVPELQVLLKLQNVARTPFFQRVQLNFKIGREKQPNVLVLEEMMLKFPLVRFVLSYNQANAALIDELYSRKKVRFDCLFDESFGEGILPQKRHAPVYLDFLQGYAGGLSAENVWQELDKIAAVLPDDAQFFIDAEGKLKGVDGHFSYANCHDFVENACLWFQQQ